MTINWTRQAAGFYTATTPAGHEIEINNNYPFGWVLRSAAVDDVREQGNDPVETLWEAKEAAEEYDGAMERSAAWRAKENARWSS
tara:strand:+ start:71 stop:325 length:255 start_codon:yes stop_codon:yes gene_type:complete